MRNRLLSAIRRLLTATALGALPFAAAAGGLQALELKAIGGVILEPAFDAGVGAYKARVQSDIASIEVAARATAAEARITVDVDGRPADEKTPMRVPLAVGANRVTIHVADAAAGGEQTYTVAVDRQDISAVVARFEKHVFTDPRSGAVMPYRLFVPDGMQAGRTYPLVVFLHGGGERGDDNESPLTANQGATIWATPDEQQRHPAFVLAPQARAAWDGGFGVTRGPDNKLSLGKVLVPSDDLKTADALLMDLLARNPAIDRSRLYVTGLSQGGFGAWAWNVMRPELFAAMVAICGGGDPQAVGALKNKPIWAFHAAADPVIPVDYSRKAIAAVEAAGGKPRYTEYDASTYFFPIAHFSWVLAYRNAEMRDWLFGQAKP